MRGEAFAALAGRARDGILVSLDERVRAGLNTKEKGRMPRHPPLLPLARYLTDSSLRAAVAAS